MKEGVLRDFPPFFMAIAKRLSFSLLISTVAFAAFSAVAFSGLFPWVEAQFYSPRMVSDVQNRLGQVADSYELWKKATLEKLDKLLTDGSFEGVLSPTPARDVLQKRFQATKLFLLGVRGGGSLRVLNASRTQLHFSTEDADVKSRTDFNLIYRQVDEVGLPDLTDSTLTNGSVHLLTNLGRNVTFVRPLKDSQGLVIGLVLLEVSLEDLRFSLAEAGIPFTAQPVQLLGPDDLLLSSLGQRIDPPVLARVQDLRAKGITPPVQRLARADGQFTIALIQKGHARVLVPSQTLEMDPVLKGILLLSFYTVLFLVVFLLMNLRGEPLTAVTRKVKRFQLQVVRQYLDLKEGDKIQSLREELTKHSDEIRSDVRRSLGKVRKRDQEWVDRYIDTSWQEVMDLLRGPAPPESSSNADWKRLETLLQQALTQGRFVVSTAGTAAPAAGTAVVPRPAPASAPLEELGDVEDIEEVEEVEDLEEVEALDEVEEAEVAPVPQEDRKETPVSAGPEDDLEELATEVEDWDETSPDLDAHDSQTTAPRAQASGSTPRSDEASDLEELEELENDEGELEALPPSVAQAEIFHPRTPAPGATEVIELFDSVDDRAADEEVLDELEEVLEEVPEDTHGTETTYTLDQLDASWGTTSLGVFEELGDVVTIRDEIFRQSSTGRDDFGALVDEVMAGPESDSFLPLEDDVLPRRRAREWRWTGGGFDWDRFAGDSDEVSLFRALSEIVTALDAFTAAILTDRDGVWNAENNVGFSDSGKELLSFGPESPLVQQFLKVRALHVINGGTSHPVLNQAFHPKDLKFLKSIMCVPILFHRSPAWLLLGMRKAPEDALNLLAPRRIE